ncbi:MAG: nucleotide exchange factor GrpE [Bdellovibrionota bacterium]
MSDEQEKLEKLMEEAVSAVSEVNGEQDSESNEEPSEASPSKEKEYYDRLLRVSADFDNFRKRAQKDKIELVRFGHESFARELLEVVDNFERAMAHSKSTSEENNTVLQGIRMIFQQLQQSLEKFHIRGQSALGKSFDPNLHEAMNYVETSEHAPNEVIEEHKKAYFIHDRLLRPALVTVAKAVEDHADPSMHETNENLEESQELIDQQTIGISSDSDDL